MKTTHAIIGIIIAISIFATYHILHYDGIETTVGGDDLTFECTANQTENKTSTITINLNDAISITSFNISLMIYEETLIPYMNERTYQTVHYYINDTSLYENLTATLTHQNTTIQIGNFSKGYINITDPRIFNITTDTTLTLNWSLTSPVNKTYMIKGKTIFGANKGDRII